MLAILSIPCHKIGYCRLHRSKHEVDTSKRYYVTRGQSNSFDKGSIKGNVKEEATKPGQARAVIHVVSLDPGN